MSSVRLVRLKTGDNHDVQHGVVRLKADSSMFPERVGVTPNCSVGLRVSGTKTGKNPETGCFLLFFAFLHTTKERTQTVLYSPISTSAQLRQKRVELDVLQGDSLHEQFPALPTRPCHFTHKQDNLFLRCTHSCLFILHVNFFLLYFNLDLAKVAVSILFFASNYINQFFTYVLD